MFGLMKTSGMYVFPKSWLIPDVMTVPPTAEV